MGSVYEQFSEDEIIDKLKEYNTKDVLHDLPIWNEEHPDDPPVGFAMMQDSEFAAYICRNSEFEPPPDSEPQIMAGCISRRVFVSWVAEEKPNLDHTIDEAIGELGMRFPILYATRHKASLEGVDDLAT